MQRLADMGSILRKEVVVSESHFCLLMACMRASLSVGQFVMEMLLS